MRNAMRTTLRPTLATIGQHPMSIGYGITQLAYAAARAPAEGGRRDREGREQGLLVTHARAVARSAEACRCRRHISTAVDMVFRCRPGAGALAALYTQYWDSTGHPVLALLMGFTDSGLPLSLQIAGRPFEETTVLRAGDAFQQATNWHLQAPASTVPRAAPVPLVIIDTRVWPRPGGRLPTA